MNVVRWRVALAEVANRDFVEIIEYTIDKFGLRQARIYRATLKSALKALEAGPELRDSVARDEFPDGVCSLHVARKGRRGRHMIIFREGPDCTIEVLRILHDALDLKQRAPKAK